MKVHEILPGFYIRGKFRKHDPRWYLDELGQLGINVLVNLTRTPDLAFGAEPGEHCNWAVMIDGTMHPLTVIWNPVVDGHLRDSSGVEALADKLAGAVKLGLKVLVYCNAGRDRAGLIATLVTARVLGIDDRAALEHVRARRPNAVVNPYFRRYIEEGSCS